MKIGNGVGSEEGQVDVMGGTLTRAHRKAETPRRMRGSTQEAPVEDDDEGEMLVLEIPQAVALCMGIEKYNSLPTLPGIQEETLRLLGALRQVPRCLAIGWYQQDGNSVNVETFIKENFSAMKSLPPTFALLHFSGHVVVHRSTGELWLAAPSCSADDVVSDKKDSASTRHFLIPAHLVVEDLLPLRQPSSPPHRRRMLLRCQQQAAVNHCAQNACQVDSLLLPKHWE